MKRKRSFLYDLIEADRNVPEFLRSTLTFFGILIIGTILILFILGRLGLGWLNVWGILLVFITSIFLAYKVYKHEKGKLRYITR